MSISIPRQSSIVAALVVALCFCAVRSFDAERRAAEMATVTFHSDYNAEQWQEIYRHTDPHFSKATTEADFTQLLTIVHRKMGNFVASRLTHWRAKAYPDGTNVVLEYETEWERGKGVEQFEFEIKGGKPALAKYMCNSPRLLLDK